MMGRRRSLPSMRMLITGASQGIGEALAEVAAARGVKVLAAARSADLLQQLAERVRAKGGILETVVADVTVPADRQAMADAAQQKFGGLDILVNNAGIGATGHFVEASSDRLRQIMEVNLFGTTETTRVCLPLLKESAAAGGRPAIVNISSIAGRRGIPARAEYSASKFAVQGFSESLRAELAKDGVDVIVVSPGLTATNFSQNMLERKALQQYDHLRGMTPQEAAEAIVRATARGAHETTLTRQGKLMVLVSRFFPRIADRIAAKRVRRLFTAEIAARRARQGQSAKG